MQQETQELKTKVWKTQQTIYEVDGYNRWHYNAVRRFLGKRILDVGSGVGCVLQYFFESPAELIVGSDISEGNVKQLQEQFSHQSVKKDFISLDISGSIPWERLKRYRLDTIVCTNVLEHIKDESIALKNMNTLLDKGGKLILTLPAYSFLYGYFDKKVGHYRRYTRKEIVPRLNSFGFKVMHTYYLNVPGILIWQIFNLMNMKKKQVKSHFQDPSKIILLFKVLSFFNPLIKVYAALEQKLKLPFGLSLVCIAEKIEEPLVV